MLGLILRDKVNNYFREFSLHYKMRKSYKTERKLATGNTNVATSMNGYDIGVT